MPKNSSDLPASIFLKLVIHTNTSLYTLPPRTALSRIIFRIKDFDGSLVPVSAYIELPYSPRNPKGRHLPSHRMGPWNQRRLFPPVCQVSHTRNLGTRKLNLLEEIQRYSVSCF